MSTIKAANGQFVTEDMLDRWTEALDRDEWPMGEYSIGPVVKGRPSMSPEGSVVLSVKIPVAMKRAIETEAVGEGVTTSDFVRTALASYLIKTA